MITLEVGKQYKTNDNAQVTCVYRNDKSMFLMVVDDSNLTFWVTENGTCRVVKEIPRRKAATGFMNVYEEEDGTLYGGGSTHASLDIAARNAGKSRVGVVEVTLVNNIETGEVEE